MKKIKVLVYTKVSYIEEADIYYINYSNSTKIQDLINKICDKDGNEEYSCSLMELEEEFEPALRAYFGKKIGKIDWNMNMLDLPVKYVADLNDNFLVLYCLPRIGGIDPNIIEIIKTSFNIFKDYIAPIFGVIYKFIRPFIITKKDAFRIMKENTGYDKHYIESVILSYSTWNRGFISKQNINRIDAVEKKIMRSFGYKLIENKWELQIKDTIWRFH